MIIFPKFEPAINFISDQMKNLSYEFRPTFWQGMRVAERPEALMRETLNLSFTVRLHGGSLKDYAGDIKPNLPWADEHFRERVSRIPMNPGKEWANWPWALSADRFRTEGEKFTHTYMERYWPSYAGYDHLEETFGPVPHHHGIRYAYGDLDDVVSLLYDQPDTRQAFLPVWFPEDTGVLHGGRVPCTLGYLFMQRNGYFHMTYYIRSCDFYRHFRDDLYLSVRLHLWVLEQLSLRHPEYWAPIQPGLFTFHCASMHMFINDYRKLYG